MTFGKNLSILKKVSEKLNINDLLARVTRMNEFNFNEDQAPNLRNFWEPQTYAKQEFDRFVNDENMSSFHENFKEEFEEKISSDSLSLFYTENQKAVFLLQLLICYIKDENFIANPNEIDWIKHQLGSITNKLRVKLNFKKDIRILRNSKIVVGFTSLFLTLLSAYLIYPYLHEYLLGLIDEGFHNSVSRYFESIGKFEVTKSGMKLVYINQSDDRYKELSDIFEERKQLSYLNASVLLFVIASIIFVTSSSIISSPTGDNSSFRDTSLWQKITTINPEAQVLLNFLNSQIDKMFPLTQEVEEEEGVKIKME